MDRSTVTIKPLTTLMKTDTLQSLIAVVEDDRLEELSVSMLDNKVNTAIRKYKTFVGEGVITEQETDRICRALVELSSTALILAAKLK